MTWLILGSIPLGVLELRKVVRRSQALRRPLEEAAV